MNVSDLLSVIILLGLVPIAVIWAIGQYQQLKHRERMAMIEKGLGASLLDKKENPFMDILLWGLLSFGIGLGLLTGYLLMEAGIFRDDMILGIAAMLFGGISMIGYSIYKKSAKN